MEFGEEFGYGVLLEYEYGFVESEPTDPNVVYIAGLSESKRAEYMSSLEGEFDEDDGQQTGCRAEAERTVMGVNPFSDPGFASLYDQINAELRFDPDLVAAVDLWAECMFAADPAYGFDSTDAPRLYIHDLLFEAQGLRKVAVDPETGRLLDGSGAIADGYTATESGDEWTYVGEERLPTSLELDRLRATELTLWAVDNTCRDTSNWTQVQAQLQDEMTNRLASEYPEFVSQRD